MSMHFIEHIVEPTKLLLAWQSSDERQRTRYIVAELRHTGGEFSLFYLPTTKDFVEAQKNGFEAYPAFQDTAKVHHNVLDAFMRRLPPKTRGDFPQYLESLRLRPGVQISDFALLGYSGAKLLSDGFSIIHLFDNVHGPCELLLEAAGYTHVQRGGLVVSQNTPVCFSKEFSDATQTETVRIDADGNRIGYVNRGLLPTFFDWMSTGRITGAWIEKINGTPGKPAVYIFVTIAPK